MKSKIFNIFELRALLVAAFVCIVIWAIGVFTGDSGRLGDRASALEALFSAAGIIGLLATLYLQRKELRYQRQELRLTRKELELTRIEVKKSAEAQQNSERALTKQAATMMLGARINAVSATLTTYENRYILAVNRGGIIEIKLAKLQREKYRISLEALGEEILFLDQCELFSPEFAFVTLAGTMNARVLSELNFISAHYEDDYQFSSLYNSIIQVLQTSMGITKSSPPEIRRSLSNLLHFVVHCNSGLQIGQKSNLERNRKVCEDILTMLNNLKGSCYATLKD